MKRSLCAPLCFVALLSHGQYEVLADVPKKEREEVMAQFKATTTIFFLRTSDADDLHKWEEALSKAWTLTPLEVHPINDIGDFQESMKVPSGYSFMLITPVQAIYNGFVTEMPRLDIWLPWKTSIYRDNVERFQRTVGHVLLDVSLRTANWDKTKDAPGSEGGLFTYLYTDAEIRNWTPQFIAHGLQFIAGKLAKGEGSVMFNNIWEEADYRAARTDSLFVRGDMMETWDLHNRDGWFLVEKDKDLALTCPKDVRLVSADELEAKLASGDRFQYVTAIRSGRSQIIMVQNSWDGSVIYLDKDYHLQTAKMFKRLCVREKL